jgi:hypothetical protein
MSSGGSVRHPLFARVYASIAGRGEEAGQAEHRQELRPGMRGRVVEVGAGGGRGQRRRVVEVGPAGSTPGTTRTRSRK